DAEQWSLHVCLRVVRRKGERIESADMLCEDQVKCDKESCSFQLSYINFEHLETGRRLLSCQELVGAQIIGRLFPSLASLLEVLENGEQSWRKGNSVGPG